MFLKMNQDTYGDLVGCQESLGMTFDITRLHNTGFQEVRYVRISKILSELWLCPTPCAMRQDMRWTQLESTSKIIIMNVDNSSFKHNLTIGNLKPAVNRQPMFPLRGPEKLAESQHAHKKSE